MGRLINRVDLWHMCTRSTRKCLKLRYLLNTLLVLIFLTYLSLINHAPSDQSLVTTTKSFAHKPFIPHNRSNSTKCHFDQIESLLRYRSANTQPTNDTRPQPTLERLQKLFQILISHEEKYRRVFDYLGIFRFTDISQTLRPFANNLRMAHEIDCLFQRYITVSADDYLTIAPSLLVYLRQVSIYLSDGFQTTHATWNNTSIESTKKPVIVLAANVNFYDTLQASMRTVDQYFPDSTVAIYDLGFAPQQLNMIKENCARCLIIPFPFAEVEPVAAHVRMLGTFAWKPVVIQDAVQRFGSIIYGDTSVRYQTANFDRLLIDNLLRGFSCRELPGHYLPCFTLRGTFGWFNETSAMFEDVYIAEAGFLAVTDNFLSRLVLKTWVTCALDSNCIAPTNSRTECKRIVGLSSTHRYDQSAMVTALSFYFFPSLRQDQKTNPAPYDMYASIQSKIAEVRRFEGDKTYFTARNKLNSSAITVKT